MKREIKFRGKRYGDGAWVYGSLYQGIKEGEKYSIILTDSGYHLAPPDDRNLAIAFEENEVNVVIPDTVGQFTGLHDKYGAEIYEGHIVRFDNHLQGVSIVLYDSGQYTVESKNYSTALTYRIAIHAVIIGNIHDNPELLSTNH